MTSAPWPRASSEWLGLAAGFLFALGNVLVRKLDAMGDAAKSIVVWIGVAVAGLVHLHASPMAVGEAVGIAWDEAPLVAGIAVALLAMSLAFQYAPVNNTPTMASTHAETTSARVVSR